MSAEHEVRIERLAAGGDGVGRLADGRVVFVPWTAPGDRAHVVVEEEHRRYARARLVALVEAGPGRADPVCPVFGECGGCTWQHLTYETQLAAKRTIVRDALRRLGGVDLTEEVSVVPSPAAYGYRSRARVLVRGGRVGYRRRRSHALCTVERCPVLTPKLEAKLARLARRRPRRDGEVELFEGRVRVGADELRVSSGVFAQSNGLLVGALAEAVARAAAPPFARRGSALELFAGVGTFTLPLARRFERVEAVEGSARAADDLRANLAGAGLRNVDVRVEAVETALAKRADGGAAPDCVVLDPPRKGLVGGGAASLAALGAPRLVYVSCDPATLARDVAVLAEVGGYRVARVQVFDLFPQTAHVETLALLERARGEGPG